MIAEEKSVSDAEIVIVRERGINAKGFGHVAKAIVTDPNISCEALGIYGYLSSMAGSGGSAYMRRSRLLEELGISKNTYDKYLQELEDSKYITRAQSRNGTGRFGTTVIEFVMVPPHLAEKIDEAQKNEAKPTMYSGTIYALGYGTIPKLVMQDTSMSAKEKGFYTLICAFAGLDGEAFPTRDQIMSCLGISKNTYHAYLKKLKQRGYITTFQKHINGRLTNTCFRLNQYPVETAEARIIVKVDSAKENESRQCKTEKIQCTKIWDTVEKEPIPEEGIQCTKIWDTVKEEPVPEGEIQCTKIWDTVQCTKLQCTENWDTVYITNTILSTNTNIDITNTIFLKDRWIARLREQIDYNILVFAYEAEPQGLAAVERLLNAVADVFVTPNTRIQINREVLQTSYVRNVLMQINNVAAMAVVERYLSRADTIANPDAYLLTAIYNEILHPSGLSGEEEEIC